MADGIITSLKKKFNELGNERLIEIYEVELLNFDKKPPVHADTINQHCCSKLHHLFFPRHLLHYSEHATLQ